ncbi:MAG: hypothetical protein LKE46_02000 [Clostridium sp.]|uniref:hypothetical protein n=1 Tax=Clostridium sp. TaxID=1506 RepID=UPI0025C085E1|nr:hypothetical protein [Clostridium sp.]MCH3963024.1 hypothetical protein [Clostridium sp.]MCI1871401.1 hypothetical protein [Clostridium sp.]MCI2202946.1 hypothetical protein [Clostridium sp.]
MNYIDDKENAIQLMNYEFPNKIKQRISTSIYKGYSLVNLIKKDDEMYQNDLGKDILPFILNLAVQYEFIKAINKNLLPFKYSIKLNHKKNCHHIELESQKCIITISQLNKEYSIPRSAIFRQNRSLNNGQISFLKDYTPIDTKKFFVIITHEKLNNSFEYPKSMHIGFPNVKCSKWIYNIPLISIPYIKPLYPKEEQIDDPNVDIKNFKKFVKGDI